MPDIFDTSKDVDPMLFEDGNSTDGAESTTTTEDQTQGQEQQEQQQAPEQTETPKLYANKYKTVEEMESAYLEAQKTLTKTTMELATMRKPKANPEQKDTSLENQQAQEQQIDWKAAYQADPVKTMYAMIQMALNENNRDVLGKIEPITSQFEASKNFEAITGQYPDFGDYADKALEILSSSPELYALQNHLEIGYKLAKAEGMEEKAKTAYESGKKDAYQLDKQKQGNIFDNKSTRSEAQSTPEEEIMQGIMKAGGAWRSVGI